MTRPERLSDADFAQLTRNAPLVSVDIVIRDGNRGILLALRNDEPAKNYFFVPGGRIFKNESIAAAFERVLRTEIGYRTKFSAAHLIGVFEHIYRNNRFHEHGYGTHYVVLAYEILVEGGVQIRLDGHHSVYKWAKAADVMKMADVHDYVKAYLPKLRPID